jgi:hypothetical protein
MSKVLPESHAIKEVPHGHIIIHHGDLGSVRPPGRGSQILVDSWIIKDQYRI